MTYCGVWGSTSATTSPSPMPWRDNPAAVSSAARSSSAYVNVEPSGATYAVVSPNRSAASAATSPIMGGSTRYVGGRGQERDSYTGHTRERARAAHAGQADDGQTARRGPAGVDR